ncbi:MAG: NAD-dependent epimerase/dehydratase family protein [Gemmatimonadales bacterium]
MNRNVLVTGGAGFIGSHVATAYAQAEYTVTVLDDLSTGRRENLPPGVRLVVADIRSPEARTLVAQGGFSVLNHHAAHIDVRRSVADPHSDADVNILGLLNLLEGARSGGVRRVVFASSGGAIYGDDAPLPAAEHAAKAPASPYGTAKLAAEYYLAAAGRLYGFETVALRYSNVYGPRQDPKGEGGVVAIFTGRLLTGAPLTVFGDGDQTRDLVFVGDVAAANVRAAEVPLPPTRDLDTRAFNIGTSIETSVNRLATVLAGAAGRAADLRYAEARAGEVRRSALSVDKARRDLGWWPRISLAEGLRATAQWQGTSAG